MTDQQVSDRGVEAARILESQVFKDAMEGLKSSVVAKWRAVSSRDAEGLILTHQMMTLAETFESLLAGYVEAGKFANRKLEIDNARSESAAKRIMRRVL
jgi:hypothetical protein